MEDKIFCPLVDKKIDIIECVENRDIKEESIPQKYKMKVEWKNICEKCKYHNF